MGARPIARARRAALLAIRRPAHAPPSSTASSGGVAAYGNCVGVPTVGGRSSSFDPSLTRANPLVNVMAIAARGADADPGRGARPGQLRGPVRNPRPAATASAGPASLASATFQDERPQQAAHGPGRRPVREKLLIEASLELIDRAWSRASRAPGRWRISCAAPSRQTRPARASSSDLDAIPRREPGMAPWEVMISESQERMLATCRPEKLPGRARGLRAVGHPDRAGRAGHDGRDIAQSSRRHRPGRRTQPQREGESPASQPERSRATPTRPLSRGHAAGPAPAGAGAGNPAHGPRRPSRTWHGPGRRPRCAPRQPHLSSRRWVYEQVRRLRPSKHRRVAGSWGRGAASQGHEKALVATTDGNQTVSALDPHLGAQLSVAEATRNVSITGARPLGITKLPQLRQPGAPEAFWQLQEAVRGNGRGLAAPLVIPVTGATSRSTTNTRAAPSRRHPRSAWWALLLDDISSARPAAVHDRGRQTSSLWGRARRAWPVSAYASPGRDLVGDAPPGIELDREAALQSFIPRSHRPGPGGRRPRTSLAVDWPWPVAECCMWSGLGAQARLGRFGLTPAHRAVGEEPLGWFCPAARATLRAIDLLGPQFGLHAETPHGGGGAVCAIELTTGRNWRGRGARLWRGHARDVSLATCATPGTTARPAPSRGTWSGVRQRGQRRLPLQGETA